MKRSLFLKILFWCLIAASILFAAISYSKTDIYAQAPTQIDIFVDDLSAAFQDWSWGTEASVENGEWNATINDGWGALRARAGEPLENITGVSFRARGDGQPIRVMFEIGDGLFNEGQTIELTNQMQRFTIPHDGATIQGVAWQETTGNGGFAFVIDDIFLLTDGDTGASTPTPSIPTAVPTTSGIAEVQLSVDPTDMQNAIDPHIYGISFATAELAADLALPINRWGGNSTTRYNWKESVSNKASDWYFLNVPDEVSNVNDLPHSATSNKFVEQNMATNTDTLLTIPLIGWTPNGRNDNCGFRVSQYGAQNSVEPFRPDCGNGVSTTGTILKGQSPEDTSMAIDETYTQEWMTYLRERYGNDAVRYYALDNEPMLWDHTHRDVHPEAVGYDEIRDLAYQYAPAIKQIDPQAQTLGPVVWGWTAYEFSAKDQADGGDSWWANPPDRNAHDGKPFLAWYLEQMAAYENANDLRILDYLDIHYYPQANQVALTDNVSTEIQALRLRSTRSLWDPTYMDESWIGEEVQLVPRMQQLIAQNYPDTKLAITEYNWGAGGHINGALAQADVLGILGREGVDMAMFWADPDAADPVSYAFRMYRNYDGVGGQFGGQSVRATSSNQDDVSVYAATRADGAITIMLINKALKSVEVSLNVATLDENAAVYQYSAQNLNEIVRLADRPATGNMILPRDSVQLLVIGGDGTAPATPVATATPAAPTTTPTAVPTNSSTPVQPTAVSTTSATPVQPTAVSTTSPTPVQPTAVPTTSATPIPTSAPTTTPTPTPTGGTTDGEISGQLFEDVNGNGQHDSNEPVLSGVTIVLFDVSVSGQTLSVSTVTDEQGFYQFTRLPEASYRMTIALPSAYVSSPDVVNALTANNIGTIEAPYQNQNEHAIMLPFVNR